MDHFAALSPEVRHLIFSCLDPASVKNATLVSKSWRAILEDASGKFWKWAVLQSDRIKSTEDREKFLQASRLPLVSEFRIGSGTEVWILSALLEGIADGITVRLKKLELNIVGAVCPSLMSRAVLKLEECLIYGGQSAQLQAILTGIQDSTNTSLKSLTLGSRSLPAPLPQVAPGILAGAAVKLEELDIWSQLSSVQLEVIFTRIAGSQDSKLRKLTYYQTADLSGMDPDDLSQAFIKLETVGLIGFWVKLSPDQVLSLFSRIRESPLSDLRLIELHLNTSDVSLVPPEVFAGALSRLETVEFSLPSGVPRAHLEALFMLMEEAGGSKLKQLRFCFTDLSSVSPEILVGIIQRLERVVVWGGVMTADQVTTILTMLKENQQGRLKDIWIDGPRFDGSVSPALLQQAKLNTAVMIDLNI